MRNSDANRPARLTDAGDPNRRPTPLHVPDDTGPLLEPEKTGSVDGRPRPVYRATAPTPTLTSPWDRAFLGLPSARVFGGLVAYFAISFLAYLGLGKVGHGELWPFFCLLWGAVGIYGLLQIASPRQEPGFKAKRVLIDGRPLQIWGSIEDLENLRRAAVRLERSERHLASAERVAQTGSWTFDPANEEIQWSRHFFEMCGVDPETFTPTPENNLAAFHEDDRQRWHRALQRAVQEKTSLDAELRIFRRDGDMRYFYNRAEPVLDEEGNVALMIGVSRDITQRKRNELAQKDLELQVRQLQKLEAIGTLAGGIAHDFNNILSATMGYTDMALMELPESHPAAESLREIEKASLRAKDLVEQILGYSRHVDRQRETIPLEGVILEALGLIRASLPASIEIREEMRANNQKVYCDGSQIHQVVVNLCTNAFQAMPEGGVLRIGLDHLRSSEPISTATGPLPAAAYARLRVADTGLGMSPEIVERVFDPFFTTKDPGSGTGLGLSTVKGIVLDHQGGIDVRSEPGEGAVFDVYLPLDERAATADQALSTEQVRGHRETILFLDDEIPLMTLGEKMLDRLGYRALAFNSAITALDVFSRDPERFDLVITDLRMPEMSGLEVAQELRQISPHVRVIVSTGYSETQLENQLASGIIHGTLLKPFNLAEMGRCVAEVLDRDEAGETRFRSSTGARSGGGHSDNSQPRDADPSRTGTLRRPPRPDVH